jgi:hypothetical protein
MMVVGTYGDLDGSVYEKYVQTPEFTYSIAYTLALSFPLSIDLFLDLMSYHRAEALGFRVMSVASIQITGIAALIGQHTGYGPTAAFAFISWSYFIDVGIVTSLLYNLLPRYFTLRRILVINVLCFAAMLFFNLNNIPGVSGPTNAALLYVAFFSTITLIMVLFAAWVLDLYLAFKVSD